MFLRRPFLVMSVFLVMSLAQPVDGSILHIDFEGDTGWTGTDSFQGVSASEGALPNQARWYDFIDTNIVSESGVWIDDPTRSFEGDRMFWLRPYNDPDTICVGGRVDAAIPGTDATYTFEFAAFDNTQPGGDPNTFSKPAVEIMWYDGTNWIVETADIMFDDGQVTNDALGLEAEYEVSDWNDLQWHQGTTNFTVPDLNGQPLFLWTSMTNDSAGMLIDNILINVELSPVPEPSAMAFAMLGLAMWGCSRRQRSTGDAVPA